MIVIIIRMTITQINKYLLAYRVYNHTPTSIAPASKKDISGATSASASSDTSGATSASASVGTPASLQTVQVHSMVANRFISLYWRRETPRKNKNGQYIHGQIIHGKTKMVKLSMEKQKWSIYNTCIWISIKLRIVHVYS